jgi:pimeloyl-ACP methyl ester carboxylesterase
MVPLKNGSVFVSESGDEGDPIVFSHGLLWSYRMFEAQIEALKAQHHCIGYDHRGQGGSELGDGRIISIESLTDDAIELIETLNIAPCHFVGLSMGGFVGMRIAARRPDLIRSLVLMATAGDEEPRANLPRYNLLGWMVRLFGVRCVYRFVLAQMFGPSFLKDPARRAERDRWTAELLRNRRSIIKTVRGVFDRKGVLPELANIRCPTLVLHGDEDQAITLERGKALAAAIPGAAIITIPTAGHTLSVENAMAVNAALVTFFRDLT